MLERLRDYEQWLLFQRTKVWFSAPIWQFTIICDFSSRDSDTLSWLLQSPGTLWYRYTHEGKIPIHVEKKKAPSKIKLAVVRAQGQRAGQCVPGSRFHF